MPCPKRAGGFAPFLHTNCRTAEALTSAIDELKTRRQDAGKRLDDAPEEMRIRAQAVIESASLCGVALAAFR